VTSFVTEALTREHDRTAFRCGVEALDRYLREFALQDMRRRVSGCFIALDEWRRIIGFYTLATTSVAIDALPPELTRRLPPYPLVPGGDHGPSCRRRIDRMRLDAFAMIVDGEDDRRSVGRRIAQICRVRHRARRSYRRHISMVCTKPQCMPTVEYHFF
jgi:hypothetical protein